MKEEKRFNFSPQQTSILAELMEIIREDEIHSGNNHSIQKKENPDREYAKSMAGHGGLSEFAYRSSSNGGRYI